MWCNTSGIRETIRSSKNKFYIGDPCYALKEKLYEKWLDWGREREEKEGRYCNDGLFVSGGKPIMAVDSTAYGDGCYAGLGYNVENQMFGVDAGCLSAIPIEFCDREKLKRDDLGVIVTVKPGTGVNLITHSAEDSKPGSFLFSFTLPDGKHAHIDVSTRMDEDEGEDDFDPWADDENTDEDDE
jgi:hypothetical protein